MKKVGGSVSVSQRVSNIGFQSGTGEIDTNNDKTADRKGMASPEELVEYVDEEKDFGTEALSATLKAPARPPTITKEQDRDRDEVDT